MPATFASGGPLPATVSPTLQTEVWGLEIWDPPHIAKADKLLKCGINYRDVRDAQTLDRAPCRRHEIRDDVISDHANPHGLALAPKLKWRHSSECNSARSERSSGTDLHYHNEGI